MSYLKNKNDNLVCYGLSFTAAFCYCLGYVNLSLVTIAAVLYLLLFYYLLLKYGRIEFYLFTLLVYRPFINLLFPTSTYTALLGPLLLIYIPLLKFCFLDVKFSRIYSCKWVLVFLLFSLIHGCYFGTLSEYIIKNRYLSLIVFVVITVSYNRSINFNTICSLFRPIFFISLLVWISPNYLERTTWLLCDYGIFGEIESVDMSSFFLPRNFGFYYDCRIFGLFAVLYFCISLLRKYNWRKFDILLSSVVVLSTLSRGAILLWFITLIGYYLQVSGVGFKKLFVLCAFLLILYISMSIISHYSVAFSELQSTFSVNSENSALGQRAIFLLYALSCFYSSPYIGIGAGALKGYELFPWGGGYNKETYITDSFLASTLGEIGLVGFILFLLYLFEIYYNKSIFSLFLILGLLVQMLGTDVPDIGLQYFVLIYLFKSLLKSNEESLCI